MTPLCEVHASPRGGHDVGGGPSRGALTAGMPRAGRSAARPTCYRAAPLRRRPDCPVAEFHPTGRRSALDLAPAPQRERQRDGARMPPGIRQLRAPSRPRRRRRHPPEFVPKCNSGLIGNCTRTVDGPARFEIGDGWVRGDERAETPLVLAETFEAATSWPLVSVCSSQATPREVAAPPWMEQSVELASGPSQVVQGAMTR